jgi:hypothetical protein
LSDQDKSDDLRQSSKSSSTWDNSTPSERVPEADSEQKATAISGSDASEVVRELHWLEKLNMGSQISLVVIGIVAASIYGCQLHTLNGQLTAMNGSNVISSESLQSVQRAFMNFDNLDLHFVPIKDSTDPGILFGARFENVGTTPANNVIPFLKYIDFQVSPTARLSLARMPNLFTPTLAQRDCWLQGQSRLDLVKLDLPVPMPHSILTSMSGAGLHMMTCSLGLSDTLPSFAKRSLT